MIPVIIIFEPLSECMMLGVLASLAVEYMFDISPLAFFLLHVLVWFLLDYILMQIVEVSIVLHLFIKIVATGE